ncbi:MAG TPA: CHRD domain-containing protein [Roseiflexaceae bacterium]|nr:CHRD domain-containing protein [Roseiflexaceae bacterium]
MRRVLATILFLAALPAYAGAAPGEPTAHVDDHGVAGTPTPTDPGSVLDAMCFGATLSAEQEVPAPNVPPNFEGAGSGLFVLSADRTRLTYHISFASLTGAETGAHIHQAPPGEPGGVVFPLLAGNPKVGTLTLTVTQTADLIAGEYYVNIHTGANPGGEIRGQILPAGGCFTAALRGDQEVPPVDTGAEGAGVFALSPDRTLLLYDVAHSGLSSAQTGQHIHRGPPGESGPVVHPLSAGNPMTGTLTLTLTDTAELLAGEFYVNVHSTLHEGGEIRGQILPASACFTAQLSGGSEVPPVIGTGAEGVGTFTLSADRTALSYRISFSGLSSGQTGAHIHSGAIGTDGDIVFPLANGSPISGTLTLTDTQTSDLLTGLYYVNVHTTTNPGGEIRGQIAPTPCSLSLPTIGRNFP